MRCSLSVLLPPFYLLPSIAPVAPRTFARRRYPLHSPTYKLAIHICPTAFYSYQLRYRLYKSSIRAPGYGKHTNIAADVLGTFAQNGYTEIIQRTQN